MPRASGQRYQQVSGDNIKDSLYLSDTILPRLPILLTEGEFDVLIAKQVSNDIVCVAPNGSAANARISSRWFLKLISAPSILICMDVDEAGERAASQILGLSRAV